jgi:hypothetical protein
VDMIVRDDKRVELEPAAFEMAEYCDDHVTL